MLYHILFGRERTTSVTVHERPDPARDRISRAEDLRFVKDGFDWGTFLVPPALFLQNKMWFGLILYIVALAGLGVAAFVFGWPASWTWIALAALHAFLAWEADEIRRARLGAQGWTMIGQVTGTSLLDCERRFLDNWLHSVPLTSARATQGSVPDVHRATPPVATGEQPRADGWKRVLGSVLAPAKRH